MPLASNWNSPSFQVALSKQMYLVVETSLSSHPTKFHLSRFDEILDVVFPPQVSSEANFLIKYTFIAMLKILLFYNLSS